MVDRRYRVVPRSDGSYDIGMNWGVLNGLLKHPFVYKYMTHEHALRLVNLHSVRLALQLNYRDEELLRIGLGDKDDGLKTVDVRTGFSSVTRASDGGRQYHGPAAKWLQKMRGVISMEGASAEYYINSTITFDRDDADKTLLFCTSLENGADVYEALNAPEYDTLVAIPNATAGWQHVLEQAIRKLNDGTNDHWIVPRYAGVAPVEYHARRVDSTSPKLHIHACCTKPEVFAPQKEARFYIVFQEKLRVRHLDIVSKPLCEGAAVIARRVRNRWIAQ